MSAVSNLKITLYGALCIHNPDQMADFGLSSLCSLCASAGYDGPFLILAGDNIWGFKMTGILRLFYAMSLNLFLFLCLPTGRSQVNPGWTSQKIWNRLNQGEHSACVRVCEGDTDSFTDSDKPRRHIFILFLEWYLYSTYRFLFLTSGNSTRRHCSGISRPFLFNCLNWIRIWKKGLLLKFFCFNFRNMYLNNGW